MARQLLILLTALTVALGSAGTGFANAVDARTRVLLELECATSETSNKLTLFANGTLRLLNLAESGREMKLGELSRSELADYLARLRKVNLGEAESNRFGAAGELVEQCRLDISLDDFPRREFRFGRLDSLSLGLSSFLAIVEELREEAIARDRGQGLPFGYLPEIGDVLLRADGSRFEVSGLTTVGGGVEVRGLDNPLVLYIPIAELGTEFVAVESERER